MNKRFLFNGKEVKVGDTIRVKAGNECQDDTVIHITPFTLYLLATTGIIRLENISEPEVKKDNLTLKDYIIKFADRAGMTPLKAASYIKHLAKIYPAAAFSIILREIAIELDKKYADHIEKSEKIYSISLTKGRIIEIDKAHIQNYRNFAAFRTIEDAKYACNILKEPLRAMFKSGKLEDTKCYSRRV